MRHMGADEMACCQCTAKGEFSSQDTGGDDLGEFARVITGVGWVRAADAEEVEHGALGFENGTAAESADFDGWHGDADLQVSAKTGSC